MLNNESAMMVYEMTLITKTTIEKTNSVKSATIGLNQPALTEAREVAVENSYVIETSIDSSSSGTEILPSHFVQLPTLPL